MANPQLNTYPIPCSSTQHVIRFFIKRYLVARQRDVIVSFMAWFAIIGICLGVATLIIVMGVMNGFRQELVHTILGFNGHINIMSPYESGIEHYDTLRHQIVEQHPQVIKEVIPTVDQQAMLLCKGVAHGVKLQGLNMETITHNYFIKDHLIAGAIPANHEEAIIIGEKLAQKLFLKVGSKLTVVISAGNATPFGTLPRMKSFKVAAIFNVGMDLYDRNAVFIPLPAAQLLFDSENRINLLQVFLHQPEQAQTIARQLALSLNQQHSPPYIVMDWQKSNAAYMNALAVERNVMFIILTLIILIASFNIITGMTMLIKDKTVDISILRALGLARRDIVKIFFGVGAAIGTIGILCGLSLGLVFAANIENIRRFLEKLTDTNLFPDEIYYLSQLPVAFNLQDILGIVGIAFGLAITAAIYPAWRAARLNPAEILR